MKKAILFSLVFLFVVFNWPLNPAMKQAEAQTRVYLDSPPDSIKMTSITPTFKWKVVEDPGGMETILKYHLRIALDFELDNLFWLFWENPAIDPPTQSIFYDGPSFDEWETYFWSVWVQVERMSIDTTDTNGAKIDTTLDTLWYKFTKKRTFFYTTATLIEIPDNIPTIQEGIIWAVEHDTVLVEPGIYYENLRFYKKGVMLASHFIHDTTNIAMINSTIIDGDSLTRREDNGSVIYFTSDADSNSKVIGFTIRKGRGTKAKVGVEDKVCGGGIFCEPGSTPTIVFNVITQNQTANDGGGIFIYEAAPNILNNIITQNSAGGSGGAIQCYYPIRLPPPAGSPGGEGETHGGIEVIPKPNLSSPGETEQTSLAPELNSKAKEDDLNNSLYPRDATEVFSGPSSDPLAKLTQNQPPVLDSIGTKTVMEGDTLEFRLHATDADLDSIILDTLDVPLNAVFVDSGNGAGSFTFTPDFTQADTYYVTFIASDGSLADSEIVEIVVTEWGNHAPELDSIGLKTVAEGDTLEFRIHATDLDLDSIILDTINVPLNAVFVDSGNGAGSFTFTPDSTQANTYYVTFIASDGSLADSEVVEIVVYVNQAPVAVCFDSLAGFTVDDSLPLDASQSFDPNSGLGDSVKSFIWKGISHITCTDTRSLYISGLNPTKEVQYFTPRRGGGIYKVCLYVKDKNGMRSENTDTLLISVQLRPIAKAGPDTIVRRDKKAYFNGSACEVNWDQKDSLKYEWFEDPGNPGSITFIPNAESQNVEFKAPKDSTKAGVFRFALRVTDPYGESSKVDDTVKVIVNALPRAEITKPESDKRFAEGDTVELDASESYDPDASVFGDSLTFHWTPTYWPGFPDKTYQPNLIIVDSIPEIAKVVPLKHGIYRFEVVVHDTISPNQDPSVLPGFNISTVTARVETTFAYPVIMGNLISSNTAELKGGGLNCCVGSSPEIINNIFYKNKSGSSGGAICYQSFSAPLIRRNIFFGNISVDGSGGAIADLRAELSPSASIGFRPKPEVVQNCFWNNVGEDLYHPPADVFDNIYVYPRLIDPEYGDFRLECSSPCLGDAIGLLLWLYPDTCGTVPPPSMISLSLFQNPVATAVADFLVNTDVPLKAPPKAYVTIGEHAPAPVYFTSIFSTSYRGNYVFTASGTAHISLFASSVQEQDTSITRDFAVQLIEEGKIGKLVSHDSWLEVLFPQGAVKGEIYATCIPVSDDPEYSFEDEEKVVLGEAYHMGPLLNFEKELTISFPLDAYDLTEKDKTLFSIYRYEKSGWEKQVSFLDEHSICAKVKELGVYRLVYDAKQEHITGIPKTYQLFQNYPNPFNPQTMIKFDLPEAGHVNITVYNILGQKVKALVDEHQDAGHKSVNWDGKDDKGKEVASGIYFYKIKTVGLEKTKKMVLLK